MFVLIVLSDRGVCFFPYRQSRSNKLFVTAFTMSSISPGIVTPHADPHGLRAGRKNDLNFSFQPLDRNSLFLDYGKFGYGFRLYFLQGGKENKTALD